MTTIGSFRDAGDCGGDELMQMLPKRLRELLCFTPTADYEPAFLLSGNMHRLNHGAFGAPFKEITLLRDELNQFLETDPSVFYDKVCLPLVRRSYVKAREVFGTENIVLTPNCSMGMKGVMESLLRARRDSRVAFLPPLYGASQNLLKWLSETKQVECVTEVPLPECYFQEDAEAILAALDAHLSETRFSVLVADHVASQSSRILPLTAVVQWCKRNGITCVIDGTQAFHLSLVGQQWPDYYVMSTHKWFGNVKTCGIVRFGEGLPPPQPPAVSFGHSRGSAEDNNLWIGMTDYSAQITLAKVLEIYQVCGERFVKKSAALLREGTRRVGRVALPDTRDRLMTLIPVNRFETDLQQSLEDSGIEASVKEFHGRRYLRVSCYVYNTMEDFMALSRFLDYTLLLNQPTPVSLQSDPADASWRKRVEIRNDFIQTFDMYTKLFSEHMTPAAFFQKAEPLRHPLIFYYGHTAVFFMNKMVLGGWLDTTQRLDPVLESVCAVGVDEMSWDDCDPGNYPWGSLEGEQAMAEYVANITAYRAKMRALVIDMVMDKKHELTLPMDPHRCFHWIVMMGIEHERIHIETSSVIMARVPVHMLRKSDVFPACPFRRSDRSSVPQNKLVDVAGGHVEMGRTWENTPYFGWDNEFGRESAQLKPFQVSQMLVSNAEYMEFVEDGGYKTREFWTEDGWKWAQWCPKGMPLFWMSKDTFRALAQEMPMPWDWPVDVNNHEAAAFCKWKGKKMGKNVQLLSHEEWYLMRSRLSGGNHNLNLREFSSACPVDCHGNAMEGTSEAVYDVVGNVWQHSRSVLTLMPQFRAHRVYDDFTTPTIDGKHNFILGGSWTSIGDCARPEGRYGFRRHFHQFAGIRYVVSDNSFHDTVPIVYEKNIGPVVTEHFHDYTDAVVADERPLPNFPAWFGSYAAEQIREAGDRKKVLVVNGGAGRISLEILKGCPGAKVHHSDPTAALVRVLENLADTGRIQWQLHAEGEIDELKEFVDEKGEASGVADRVEYSQILLNNIGGALKHLGQYDVVVAEMSQLARTESQLPRGYVPTDLARLLRPGGMLVLSTLSKDGAKDFDASSLGPFKPVGSKHRIAHIARQTARNHRYAISEASTWQLTGPPPSVVVETPAELDTEKNSAVSVADFFSQPLVTEQFEKLHYGSGMVSTVNFPSEVAQFCVKACKQHGVPLRSALDAGCGPGRAALELKKSFQEVTAFDMNPRFVEILHQKAQGSVTGYVADAHNVDQHPATEGKRFDLILSANLIEGMACPIEFLRRCKSMLTENGVLVILSSCSWRPSWTPRENWVGEFRKDAEVYPTWQGLADVVKPELVMLAEPTDVPYAIQDPDGSSQYTISQCTVFGRKDRESVSKL